MNTMNRLIQGGVIAGFLILSSGCVIAPEGDHDRGYRDRVVHEHDHDRYRERDRDRHDRDERHCDDRDDHHCRDR